MARPTPSVPAPASRNPFRILGAACLALARFLRGYLVATLWMLVFWAGLSFLFGLVAGFQAGRQASSQPQAVLEGGLAGMRSGSGHQRLILFLAGLCVSVGLASGRLPGARKRRKSEARRIAAQAARIRRGALARVEDMSVQAGRTIRPLRRS